MFEDKKEKRSPIRDQEKPLRNPAESLEREWERLFDEEVLPYLFLILIMLVFVIYEWLRFFFKSPPEPVAVTFLGVVIIGFCFLKIYKFVIQGRQYLERLRTQGCLIFHDIPGDGFNIDHVVVSDRGVFIVETKTLIKRGKGNPHIIFNGERILVNGFELKHNPVPQALAERTWLRNYLINTTGITFPVKAVVVFPGWFVEPQSIRKDEIWVLSHKALPKFIENEPKTIKNENVHLIASRLSDYVRRNDNSEFE